VRGAFQGLRTARGSAGRGLRGASLFPAGRSWHVDCNNEAMNTHLDRIAARDRDAVLARIVALENQNSALQEANRELTAELHRLQRLVYLDPLTKLGNRRYFTRAIEAEIQRSIRTKSALTVVVGDVDEFKRCNDTYGHSVGDEVLRAVANSLDRLCRRGGDLAARLGGDEFALLLPGIDQAAAREFAGKLTTQSALEIPSLGLCVTMSFGAAVFEGTHACSMRHVLDTADRALYRAKRTGRNRTEIMFVAPTDSGARIPGAAIDKLQAQLA
jgi:diguanylate cyclase (GGDEF)-like protein